MTWRLCNSAVVPQAYHGEIQNGIFKMKWREKTDFKIKAQKKSLSDVANSSADFVECLILSSVHTEEFSTNCE